MRDPNSAKLAWWRDDTEADPEAATARRRWGDKALTKPWRRPSDNKWCLDGMRTVAGILKETTGKGQ